MSFYDHLNDHGLGEAVDVFSTSSGFTHHDMPLMAAFNPAFVVTPGGTMLAFVEGRVGSTHDLAPKTVLMNRSTDFGRTWEGMRALTAPACSFGPRPYVVSEGGRDRIHVMVAHTPYGLDQDKCDVAKWLGGIDVDPAEVRRDASCVVLRLTSDDEGDTWEQEALIGDRDPFAGFEQQGYWLGVADLTGSVQTVPTGPHAGRRFVSMLTMGTAWENRPAELPGGHINIDRLGSGIIYSDDGESWQLGGVLGDRRGNEAAATSIAKDGRILMLRRPNGFTHEELNTNPAATVGYRLLHTSRDGGGTWSAPVIPEGLPYLKDDGRRYDHHCLTSLCAHGNTILSAMPSAIDREGGRTPRTHGIIALSDDFGVTWRHRLIDAGEFSYATLERVTDDGFVVMFSRSGHGEHGSAMRAFTLDWVRDA